MTTVLVLILVIVGVLLTSVVVGGVFLIMMKLGVIAREATRPPTVDRGSYSLSQAREVGREESKD
jgi:hypothetical protein